MGEEQNNEQIQTSEQDEIVVNVINGATPQEQLEELRRMLEEANSKIASTEKELAEVKKTNLHLAMTSSAGEAKQETFEDILRSQSYYKSRM